MLKFTIVCLLLLCVLADQDIPIPSRPDGFALGSNTPQLHIEAYYDLLCPDSRDSWALLEPLLRNEYHIDTNQTLRFTIHIFPLPFHLNAFIMAQGARIIADNLVQAGDIFTYFNLIFANQEDYYTPATLQLSQNQVKQNLINLVNKALPAYAPVFADGFDGGQYNWEARVSWKYSCYKGVAGTPTYFANGVAINGAGDYLAKDWRNFINGGYVNTIFL